MGQQPGALDVSSWISRGYLSLREENRVPAMRLPQQRMSKQTIRHSVSTAFPPAVVKCRKASSLRPGGLILADRRSRAHQGREGMAGRRARYPITLHL